MWRLLVVPAVSLLSLALYVAPASAAPAFINSIAKTDSMSRSKKVAILLMVVVVVLVGLLLLIRARRQGDIDS
jgi:hypothetical protein